MSPTLPKFCPACKVVLIAPPDAPVRGLHTSRGAVQTPAAPAPRSLSACTSTLPQRVVLE